MATEPTCSFTDPTGDTSIAEPLKDVSNAWAHAFPPGVRSKVVLEKTQHVFKFDDDSTVAIQADGRWGTSEGNVLLYVRRAHDKPVNFALATSISLLNPESIFEDTQLANEIKDQLPNGPTIDLCVFRGWPGIEEARIQEISSSQPNAGHLLGVLGDLNSRLGITPTSQRTATGLSLRLDLNLADWPSAPSSPLFKRLSDIGQLEAPLATTFLALGCLIAKSNEQELKPLTAVAFNASLKSFPILDNAFLNDASLSLTISRPDPAAPLDAVLGVTGDFTLGVFDSQNPLLLKGALSIGKSEHTAEFNVDPVSSKGKTCGMAELGVIKLSNIDLHVKYTFGQPSVSLGASLTADLTVGKDVVHGSVVFAGKGPSYLLFSLSGPLDVRDLFQSVLGDHCPANLPVLSLTDPKFSYAWNTSAPTVTQDKTTISPGLTASAQADVFGIEFDAHVTFVPTGDEKGLYVSSQLLGPVNLIIASLYATNNTNSGPSVTYDAKGKSPSGLSIDGGLTILGLHFPDIHILYGKSAKDQQPCLQVDLTLHADAVGGTLPIKLEFVKIDNRTHVRLNGLPLTDIKDAFNDQQLFDKIRELTQKDPCKAIDIPLNNVLTNTWSPKVEFSKTQPKLEAGHPLQCSFDVSCVWTLTLLMEKKVVVEMEPFSIVMDVPQTWEDLLKEIVNAIILAKDKIVQSLIDDREKFTEILVFYATKYAAQQWMKSAISAWLCRHKDAPGLQPEPQPNPVGSPTIVLPPVNASPGVEPPNPVSTNANPVTVAPTTSTPLNPTTLPEETPLNAAPPDVTPPSYTPPEVAPPGSAPPEIIPEVPPTVIEEPVVTEAPSVLEGIATGVGEVLEDVLPFVLAL